MRDLVRTLFVFGVFQASQLVGPGHGEGSSSEMTKESLKPSNLKQKKRDWKPFKRGRRFVRRNAEYLWSNVAAKARVCRPSRR